MSEVDFLTLIPSDILKYVFVFLSSKDVYLNIITLSKYWHILLSPISNQRILYSSSLVLKFSRKNQKLREQKINIILPFVIKTRFNNLIMLSINNSNCVNDVFNISSFPNLKSLNLMNCNLDYNLLNFLLPSSLTKLSISNPTILFIRHSILNPSTFNAISLKELSNLKLCNLKMFHKVVLFINLLKSLKHLELINCDAKFVNQFVIFPGSLESVRFAECHSFSRIKFPKALLSASFTNMDINMSSFEECLNLAIFECYYCNFTQDTLFDINFLNFPASTISMVIIGDINCNCIVLPKKLEYFRCKSILYLELCFAGNDLKSIDLSDCDFTKFTDFDHNVLSFDKLHQLKKLVFNNDEILPFVELPTSLTEFDCCNNNLGFVFAGNPLKIRNNINMSNYLSINTNLIKINLTNNSIKFVDLFNCNLKEIRLDNNPLNSLNLPKSLTNLYINDCSLSFLPELPINLKVLECEKNEFELFPTLHNSITSLNVRETGIMIDRLPSSLTQIKTSLVPSIKLVWNLPGHLLPPNLKLWTVSRKLKFNIHYFKYVNDLINLFESLTANNLSSLLVAIRSLIDTIKSETSYNSATAMLEVMKLKEFVLERLSDYEENISKKNYMKYCKLTNELY